MGGSGKLRIMSRTVTIGICLLVLLSGCGGGKIDSPTEGKISITGAVQKGPFIVGTPVYVNKLDDRGNASSSTVITAIKDSVGSFSFRMDGSGGPVQIISDGYYFNELTGQISQSTLALKAIYNVSGSNVQQANVNILTHLINDRVLNLINDGKMSVNSAITQAQSELVKALNDVLPVQEIPAFNALSLYNISPDNSIGNAYLLALSAAFYKYSEVKAAGENTSSDAQLALGLNLIARDFADDGVIQEQSFINDLIRALRSLNPKMIAEHLKERSQIDFSTPLEIPDITIFFGLCAGSMDCPWSSRVPMPAPTRSQSSAVFQGKIYIFGGTSPNPSTSSADPILHPAQINKAVYMYDPETNEWHPKADLPIAILYSTAHTIGDKIYVFGGYGEPGFLNVVLQYDPLADNWTSKVHMPTYKYVFMSEEVNGKVYVIGGQGTIDDGPWRSGVAWEFKKDVQIFDSQNDSWTTGTPAPQNLASAASCKNENDIYIFGGDTGTDESDTYVYNVVSDSWSKKAPPLIKRNGHACVSIGGQFLLMGGRITGGQSAILDKIEIYNPNTDVWKDYGFLPTARYWFSANSVGGLAYLMGGFDDVKPLDLVEVFNSQVLSANKAGL